MNEKLTLVLMAGLPATGKSTLASELGRSLNWHIIDKDGYKEVLLRKGLDEEKAGIVSYDLAFETARNVLVKQQASVILDSAALHSFILENAQNIVQSAPNAQLKVILCVADRNLRNYRLRNRPSQITNIRVDPATENEYLKLFNHLPLDNRLTLFTSEPLNDCLIAAKDYLLDQPCHKPERNDNFLKLVEALMKR